MSLRENTVINYCPLHTQAPAMFETLELVVSEWKDYPAVRSIMQATALIEAVKGKEVANDR